MDDPFNIGKISVIIKNNNNFKVSSITVLQGERLNSSYTYQVLAGEKIVTKILEEESQSVWSESLINFFFLLVSFHFGCFLETLRLIRLINHRLISSQIWKEKIPRWVSAMWAASLFSSAVFQSNPLNVK